MLQERWKQANHLISTKLSPNGKSFYSAPWPDNCLVSGEAARKLQPPSKSKQERQISSHLYLAEHEEKKLIPWAEQSLTLQPQQEGSPGAPVPKSRAAVPPPTLPDRWFQLLHISTSQRAQLRAICWERGPAGVSTYAIASWLGCPAQTSAGLQSRAACDSLSQNVFQPPPSQCFTRAFLVTHLPITLFFLRTELRTKAESKAKWLISTLNWRCWAKHKVSRTPPCTAGESEGWYNDSAEAIGKRSVVTPGFHFPSFAGRFTLTSQAVRPGARPLSSFLLRKSPFP